MPFDDYLLMVRMEPEEGFEKEFHRWYNFEHLPSLLSLPEMTWGRRYVSIEGPASPKYAAIYGVTDPAVMETERYRKARDTEGTTALRSHFRNNTRNVYRLHCPEVAIDKRQGKPSTHNLMMVVRMEPEAGWEDEFERWYNEDHVKSLCGVRGFVSGARYRSIVGEPKFLAIYEVEDYAVFHGDEYVKARESEWTVRMRPHFRKQTRNIYLKMHEQS
jgi:hypothetical protein